MMKKILLLLLFPFGLFASTSSGIMAPTIYDLSGILTPGQKVVSMITDEGKLAEFKLNPDNNYLVIPTYGTFYYAAVADSLGNMSYLYLGPKSVVDEPLIQELLTGPTPVQAGLNVAGKGTAISWITGLSCFGIGAAVANNSSDPWAGFTWIVVGAVVAVYGTIWSVIYGAFKGVQTSMRNNSDRYMRLQLANQGSGLTYVVEPVTIELIPEELRTNLLGSITHKKQKQVAPQSRAEQL
jgi:hypothetical protein